MKKRILKIMISMALCLSVILQSRSLLTVKAETFYPAERNSYYGLLVPTQLTKIGDTFYLVDSYHDQVLYSTQYGVLSSSWKVMAKNLHQPHSIAGDGVVYLVTDTENHRVVSYIKNEEGFTELQIFDNIGVRPHYIVYDEPTGLFYVWSSMTGEMYLFRRKADSAEVYLESIMRVPELYGKYVRSFTIEGDQIYLPCVHSSSIVAVDKSTFKIKDIYPVPENIAGMVQLTRIQNYYYLTVSTDINFDQSAVNIVRARTLEDFAVGNYQSLKKDFGSDGAPYYISEADKEEDSEEPGESFVQIAAKEALIDLIREMESNTTYVYAVRDFDGDGIYELLCQAAKMEAEIGRYAYDGENYQAYGTSDEGWNFYDQEGEEEYYPCGDILAFLESDVPLPEKPGWLAEYAAYLEGWDTGVPLKVSFVSIDDDDIPECVVWIEWDYSQDNWADWECYLLSNRKNRIEEYYAGYNTDYVTCQERSGKFSYVCTGLYGNVWNMMYLVDGYGFSDDGWAEQSWGGGNEGYVIAGIVESGYDYRDVNEEEFMDYIADYTGDTVVDHEGGVQAYIGYTKEALTGAYALWMAERTDGAAADEISAEKALWAKM